jgi:ribosomal protein S18 acetylase RimI-like enzyme
LLGGFIALLAVRPDASGQGLGRALVDHVGTRSAAKRRWLFVSCDADNAAALRFYRRLGFSRVGRMPDLVARGRTELLLRKPLLLRKAAGSTMKPAE